MCQRVAVVGAVPDNGGQVVTVRFACKKMQWQKKEHGRNFWNKRANVTPYSRALKLLYLACLRPFNGA